MGQSRTYFSTRDLLMMAALAALGGVIRTFRDGGGFSAVLPGLANDVRVKGAVEIQIK